MARREFSHYNLKDMNKVITILILNLLIVLQLNAQNLKYIQVLIFIVILKLSKSKLSSELFNFFNTIKFTNFRIQLYKQNYENAIFNNTSFFRNYIDF